MTPAEAFEISRRTAYGLLGDAADHLRSHSGLTTEQRSAVSQAFQAIGVAKDALNEAAATRPVADQL
jgi:hypothetical protein